MWGQRAINLPPHPQSQQTKEYHNSMLPTQPPTNSGMRCVVMQFLPHRRLRQRVKHVQQETCTQHSNNSTGAAIACANKDTRQASLLRQHCTPTHHGGLLASDGLLQRTRNPRNTQPCWSWLASWCTSLQQIPEHNSAQESAATTSVAMQGITDKACLHKAATRSDTKRLTTCQGDG